MHIMVHLEAVLSVVIRDVYWSELEVFIRAFTKSFIGLFSTVWFIGYFKYSFLSILGSMNSPFYVLFFDGVYWPVLEVFIRAFIGLFGWFL